MSMSAKTPDRIPCVNQSCRRTAAAEKHPYSEEICCQKCWKTVPKAMRRRLAQTKARCRRLMAKLNLRYSQGQISAERADWIWNQANLQRVVAWRNIKDYLNAPPEPAGLDNFLKEIGLDRQ